MPRGSHARQLLCSTMHEEPPLCGRQPRCLASCTPAWAWLGCAALSAFVIAPAVRQVLALFGALLHGSLYLVLGTVTLLPQALRAAAHAACRQRISLLQASALRLLTGLGLRVQEASHGVCLPVPARQPGDDPLQAGQALPLPGNLLPVARSTPSSHAELLMWMVAQHAQQYQCKARVRCISGYCGIPARS